MTEIKVCWSHFEQSIEERHARCLIAEGRVSTSSSWLDTFVPNSVQRVVSPKGVTGNALYQVSIEALDSGCFGLLKSVPSSHHCVSVSAFYLVVRELLLLNIMAFRASDNLQCYMQEARLPVMAYRPPRSESGSFHVSLNARPERYRTLRLVHTINTTLFSDIISEWVDEFIPCQSLGVNDEDERTGERLTIPCEPFFSIVPLPLARAEDIERVFVWVDMFPLESTRRILNLLYADSSSWKFLPCEEAPLLKTSTWSYVRSDQGETTFLQHALCLFLMPPWLLSAKDLQEFARGQSFPERGLTDSLRDKEHCALPGMEWLWSKVWDTCICRNCPWFIVTTYTHWVFGVFSAGWTASFVSPLYAFDSRTPTVLEVLVFWLISSMGYPGGFVVPEIPHELVHRRQLLVATPRDIARSEPAEALAVLAV